MLQVGRIAAVEILENAVLVLEAAIVLDGVAILDGREVPGWLLLRYF